MTRLSLCPNGIIVGGKSIVRSAMTNTAFIITLRKELNKVEMAVVDPSEYEGVVRYLANFRMSVPVQMAMATPVAATTPVITGAGANNVDLGKVDVKIYKSSYFELKNRVYFNCIDNHTNEKFVYYLDLKNKKRYYKKDNEPSNFIRLDDMAELELVHFGVSSVEDIRKKFSK